MSPDNSIIRGLHGTSWLTEPRYIRLAVARLRQFTSCPTARELAEFDLQMKAEYRIPPRLASLGTEHPAEKAEGPKAIRAVKGKVGVIKIMGPIQQRATSELRKLGGTSTEWVGMALDSLLADSQVGAIVLHIDSPGGSSYGVEELSDKIHQARGEKTIYAHADSMCCSAAFWIASAAHMVLCTPGGDVGSVGVYCAHVDESKSLEDEGLKVTLVSAGKYKVEANSLEPLSDEARAMLQESVNETYSRFIGALKRNRNTTRANVEENYGQGRVLSADKALKAGVIDRVMTYDDLISRLTGVTTRQEGGNQASAVTPAMEQERRRQAQRKRQAEILK